GVEPVIDRAQRGDEVEAEDGVPDGGLVPAVGPRRHGGLGVDRDGRVAQLDLVVAGDRRDKTAIRDTVLGLDFITALRPVDYRLDPRDDYRPGMPADGDAAAIAAWREASKLANLTHDGSKARSRYHHGLIAQEVQALLAERGIDFGGFQDHAINGGDDVLTLGYTELIGPMIKAIQEQQAQIAALVAEVAALKR
ncbi:MAG: tail fiber domain-containing protein, partial [Chloroflexota bacterium]